MCEKCVISTKLSCVRMRSMNSQCEFAIWVKENAERTHGQLAYQYSTYKKYKNAQSTRFICARIYWKAAFVLVSVIRRTLLARAQLESVLAEEAYVCLGTRVLFVLVDNKKKINK